MHHYTNAGLVRFSMRCDQCFEKMKLRNGWDYQSNFYTGFSSLHSNCAWLCLSCRTVKSVTHASPMRYIDLYHFDVSLQLWMDDFTTGQASRLCNSKALMYQYFRVFRWACTFYLKLKVLPFLKLPGPVELDETNLGPRNNLLHTHHPAHVNWIFGQYCRTTKLSIISFTQSRSH